MSISPDNSTNQSFVERDSSKSQTPVKKRSILRISQSNNTPVPNHRKKESKVNFDTEVKNLLQSELITGQHNFSQFKINHTPSNSNNLNNIPTINHFNQINAQVPGKLSLQGGKDKSKENQPIKLTQNQNIKLIKNLPEMTEKPDLNLSGIMSNTIHNQKNKLIHNSRQQTLNTSHNLEESELDMSGIGQTILTEQKVSSKRIGNISQNTQNMQKGGQNLPPIIQFIQNTQNNYQFINQNQHFESPSEESNTEELGKKFIRQGSHFKATNKTTKTILKMHLNNRSSEENNGDSDSSALDKKKKVKFTEQEEKVLRTAEEEFIRKLTNPLKINGKRNPSAHNRSIASYQYSTINNNIKNDLNLSTFTEHIKIEEDNDFLLNQIIKTEGNSRNTKLKPLSKALTLNTMSEGKEKKVRPLQVPKLNKFEFKKIEFKNELDDPHYPKTIHAFDLKKVISMYGFSANTFKNFK
jgi:hypothetical protein